MGCPDIWCFWMRITFESIDWIKQIAFSNVGGPSPFCLRLEQNERLNKEEFLLSAWWRLSWDISLPSDADLDWNLPHQLSQLSNLGLRQALFHLSRLFCVSTLPTADLGQLVFINILLVLFWRRSSQPNTQGLFSPLPDGVSVPGGSSIGTDLGPKDREEETTGHHSSWPMLPLAQCRAHEPGRYPYRWHSHSNGSNHHRSQILPQLSKVFGNHLAIPSPMLKSQEIWWGCLRPISQHTPHSPITLRSMTETGSLHALIFLGSTYNMSCRSHPPQIRRSFLLRHILSLPQYLLFPFLPVNILFPSAQEKL